MSTVHSDTPRDEAIKTLQLVAYAGAFGGLLCWLLGAAVPDPTQSYNKWLWPFACILFGAAAGAGGVFILADSDRRHLPRCLVFATFCGLMWRPVTEAVKTAVMATVGREGTAKTVARAYDLEARPVEEVAKNLAQAGDETVRLMAALPDIEDPKMRRAVEESIERAVDTMKVAAESDPAKAKEGLEALTKVGVAAAANQETTEIAALAAESVKTVIEKRPDADPDVVNSAYKSVGDVAAAAERGGNLALAFRAREIGAETLITAAEAAQKRGGPDAVVGMPLDDAGEDLIAAQDFYRSVGDTRRAAQATDGLDRLSRVPRPEPPGISPEPRRPRRDMPP